MPRSVEEFQTIHTEGAILPPDVLQRIATGELEGLEPSTYHLPTGTKTKEAISQSWTRLLRYWKDFQAARKLILPSDETGTLATREKWLLPLFQELGYGRLTTSKAPEIDGKLFPIERFWQHIPIHLIGCKLQLDHRTKGARGAATAIPHSMVQEFLNRSAEHAWAFLSNGLQLRILRDSAALSRQSYVEFDLESMMDGEVYADFAVLWLVCHQSRLEGENTEDFWLEKWSKLAQEQGTRILEDLRNGVEKAIEALGRGFISHPRNEALIIRLQSGSLSTQDYYRQILRIVYRLLFLFVAEDRTLLHPPAPADESLNADYLAACDRYDRFYSLKHIRDLAESYRGSKHTDLWHGLSLIFDALGKPEGCPQLALPALGSFLWSRTAVPDLSGPAQLGVTSDDAPAYIRNEDLLKSVRSLAFVERNRVWRAVNYRNLGSVELGSVYESLLELHPQINIPGRDFTLSLAAGNERKTTGSFYTPDSLVQCMLESALEPVVFEVIKGKSGIAAEKAILSLRICDSAVGSGHFLIAAAHRLARHLARVRTGESEPTPGDYQHALRDVIGNCLYGVDLNPMAVELCKISLWMEALEPGKPLGFLDHRVVVGNSLLGTTPALLAHGIPDAAFEPIDGDDKAYCRAFKKQNKDERKGQGMLFGDQPPWEQLGNLAARLTELDDLPDDSVADVRTKEQRYADLVSSSTYESGRLLADAWCAAFVWKKTKEFDYPITEKIFRAIERNPHSIPPWMKQEIVRLSRQYQFFHWHIAFPSIFTPTPLREIAKDSITGWTGGFSVLLGNPPWERVQFEEQAFFESRHAEIAAESSQAKRRSMIAELETRDPPLFAKWAATARESDGIARFIRSTGRYPLSGADKFNLYAVFLELNKDLNNRIGRAGIIVKGGFLSDELCSALFADLLKSQRLAAAYEFENRRKLFQQVDSRERFVLVALAKEIPIATFSFDLLDVAQLVESNRQIMMSYQDIVLLSPNTKNCPKFSFQRDYSITKACYLTIPPLKRVDPQQNEWNISIDRYINVSDFSGDIAVWESINDPVSRFRGTTAAMVPLYEGKLLHQFDYRYSSYIPGTDSICDFCDKNDVAGLTFYRYLPRAIALRRNPQLDLRQVSGLLCLRDITNRTNERGVIAAIIPPNISDYTVRVIQQAEFNAASLLLLLGNFNSFIFDYLCRQRIGGTHLSNYVLEQTPTVPPHLYSHRVKEFIVKRTIELSITTQELQDFATDAGYYGPPFKWDDERRFLIRCELDAAFFHLYGIARDDVDYIMETFPIVKRKDVEKHGTFRTMETILRFYDEIAAVRVIYSERVWHAIFVLVGAWKKKGLAVGRPALETGLLLMFNDELRKKLLGMPASQPSAQGSGHQLSPLNGLDYFIAEADRQRWLKVTQSEYQQTIEAGDLFPTVAIPLDDITRVAETMTVINRIAQKEVELPSTGVQRVELSNKPVSFSAAAAAW